MKQRQIIFLGAIAVAFGAWYNWPGGAVPAGASMYLKEIPITRNVAAAAKSADPCENRDFCVYIYVAPWCPHCHEFIPHIGEIRNFWKEADRPGMKVVIGWEKMSEIRGMAMEIDSPVYSDEGDVFKTSLKIHSVPKLIVVDRNQRIVAQDTSAMNWVNSEVNRRLRK